MGIGKSWSSKRFWTELEDGQYELIVQRLNKSRLGVMYIFLWRMVSEPECQVGWQLVIFSVTWLLFQCDRKEHLKEKNRKRKFFKVIKRNEHVGLRRTNVKSRMVWFLVCLWLSEQMQYLLRYLFAKLGHLQAQFEVWKVGIAFCSLRHCIQQQMFCSNTEVASYLSIGLHMSDYVEMCLMDHKIHCFFIPKWNGFNY